MSAEILTQIYREQLIAVVRIDSQDHLVPAIESLIAGGVSAIELTMTIPDALSAIAKMRTFFGNRVLLGAGTVLSAQEVKDCISAGAQFIVSPITALDVIDQSRRLNVPVMAGAYTPTEIFNAWQYGADIVKVFPSDNLGPNYIKAIRGPFPQIPLMPTGGVNIQNARAFLDAGAVCLGVGGNLVDAKAIQAKDFAKITALASEFREIVPRK